jgi:hypothetical protein
MDTGERKMNSIDVAFCRELLKKAHEEVRKFDNSIKPVKDAWVYHLGRNCWEFHGPCKYYWHGRAANAYEARYKGWMAFLEQRGIQEPMRG